MNNEPAVAVGRTVLAADGVGAAVQREEACSLATVRRVAAMLDLPPDAGGAGPALLPRGWQFVLLAADTPRGQLRSDGFPGLGVPMPDLGLPRLMLGGRSVRFQHDIPVGAVLQRASAVRSVVQKTTPAGPMAVVEVEHALTLAGRPGPALVESQTYLLLPARPAQAPAAVAPAVVAAPLPAVQAQRVKTVVPDETLLFQYSALGFNSHRIHIDRDHAQRVEGFPDLVVNGGLATLLLTEFLRLDVGVVPAAITVRHVAPLFCNRTVTLAADPAGPGWRLKAYDDSNRLAVDMEVTV